MAQPNTGDTVRFLNTTGGGIVTRIAGNLAYVSDEDGFETPVLLRECVVVTPREGRHPASQAIRTETGGGTPPLPGPTPPLPADETPGGEKLNILIGFEPADPKRLSTSSFDATLVNDSNYWLHYTVATRGRHDTQWTLRAAGTLEPATQDFLFELKPEDLPDFDRIAMQAVAFKRGRDFALKAPIAYEHKVDATRFARLHCFRRNPYFDLPVIALDIVRDDVAADGEGRRSAWEGRRPASQNIRMETGRETRPLPSHPGRNGRRDASPPSPSGPLEIDLHATELLDTTAGMSASEILNYQVDYFRRIMDENIGHPGRKIIFIHGNGEGVLRAALMKELNYRYKGHEVSDASFREYGFGATMVTIRNIKR